MYMIKWDVIIIWKSYLHSYVNDNIIHNALDTESNKPIWQLCYNTVHIQYKIVDPDQKELGILRVGQLGRDGFLFGQQLIALKSEFVRIKQSEWEIHEYIWNT